MAQRFGAGTRQGAAYLRIMRDAADNPLTTSRFDYDKFMFDSQTGDLAYPLAVFGPGNDMLPSNLGYKPIVHANARMSDESVWWDFAGYDYGGTTGVEIVATNHHYSRIDRDGQVRVLAGSSYFQGTVEDWAAAIWQLPGDNAAFPFPSGAGGGSRIFQDETRFRIPRPGIDMWNSNPRNFIVHEDMAPARVMYVDSFRIGAGQTPQRTMPVDAFGGTLRPVVVGHAGLAGEPYVYPAWGPFAIANLPGSIYRVQFRWINNTTIQFREKDGKAVDIAFCVVGAPNDGTTSGGDGSAIRTEGSGSGRYLQIVRPGAANNPNWSDVLLDSRMQVMPLVDDGDIGVNFGFSQVGSNQNRRYERTVSIPTLGYKPLVLTSWYNPDHIPELGDFTLSPGRFDYNTNTDSSRPLWNTRIVEVNDGSLKFIAGNVEHGYPNASWSRCRYYVFAIPQG